MTVLSRGQRLPLPDGGTFSIEVEASGGPAADVRFGAVLLTAKGRAGSNAVVHAGSLRTPCGSVQFQPGPPGRSSFAVVPDRVPDDVDGVHLVAWVAEDRRRSAASLAQLDQLRALVSQGSDDVAEVIVRGAELAGEAAIVFIHLYRRGGWRMKAEGAGFVGGLPSMLSHYKFEASLAGQMEGTSAGRGGPGRGRSPLPPPPPGRDAGSPGTFEGLRLAADWPGRIEPEGPTVIVQGVARIVVTTTGGQLATGTGFAVNPGGYFLTCNHVVEDATAIGIVVDGFTEIRPAEVVIGDAASDVAIIRLVDGFGVESWLRLADSQDEPKLGQVLGLLGYPLGEVGLEVTYSQGVVNSLRSTMSHRVLQIDAGAAPGSSGGPVFRREDGRVIGILGGGLEGRAGMLANFAMDIRQLWALGWILE